MEGTKHKVNCRKAWGRFDATCPRCQELIAGAAPREGWQKAYFETRKSNESSRLAEIRAHFQSDAHRSGKCGPVCTYGEW